MNPATRTRLLNQWIQQHSQQTLCYPALHGFLCARLTGPALPDWQAPLSGLFEDACEPDAQSGAALSHLITELETLADEGQLALPSQCRLSTGTPEQVFAKTHPLGQWSYGFSLGLACWPAPTDLNAPLTRLRYSLAAELCLFRDEPMARMLHQAAGSELSFLDFCKRQRQQMKAALNQLLILDQQLSVSDDQQAPETEQSRQWQAWFEQAAACRDPGTRLGWFDKIIHDAEPQFDDTFWQATAGHGWGAEAARPLLAARAGRADCLLRLGELDGARAEYLALLALCVSDEPGSRHPLSSLYARSGEWDALQALLMRFDEASCWLRYNQALMIFVREGDAAAAPYLAAAMAINPHVPACLLGQRKLPKQDPQAWQAGSRDEAALYALQSKEAWLGHNALIWLRKRATQKAN
ncbi:UPF0149 family protein [Aeromonas veronii]|uniref:UPF0149 family protein n=1 Tax=Aeromonas veronii TaxID=654 RepID=UPI0032EBBF1E